MNSPAEQALRAVEAAGGRLVLVRGGIVVEPSELLDAALRARVRSCGRDLVDLLRQRHSDRAAPDWRRNPGKPSPSPLPTTNTRTPVRACELRRFTDWRTAEVIRFCCEPDHGHEDGVPTYDLEECSLIVAWSAREGMRSLPIALRNALLSIKARFGGTVVLELSARSTIGRDTPS